MLDAVVSGTIFASPNPTQIFNALRDLDRRAKSRGVDEHSVLVILMNYTGEDSIMRFLFSVSNYGCCRRCHELWTSGGKGKCSWNQSGHGKWCLIPASRNSTNEIKVIVGDDVSVGRTKGGKVGRRGIGGTVYVHKVAGALAEEGYVCPNSQKPNLQSNGRF